MRITSVLGRGGFATVYAGVQDSLGHPIAVKVDSRPLDGPRDERRFMREMQAASGISGHPHVVSLIDTSKLPDLCPYLVMKPCAGGSLYDLVSHGPIPVSDAMALVEATASALGAAHAAGIMHRDVKPASILLDSYGSPRLSDFGITTVQREGQDPTVTLECLTPDFAAPEAFMLTSPDPEGDVWSMGTVLFALLTGRGPRRGPDDMQYSLSEIVRSLDDPLSLTDPNVPELLLPVLSKAMAPDPAYRFRDGTELTEALGQIREALGTGNLAVRRLVTSLQLIGAGLAPPPRSGEVGSSSSYAPSGASQWEASGSVFPVRPTGSLGSTASAPSIVLGRLEHSDRALLNVSVSTQRSQSLRLPGREHRWITLRSAAVGAVASLVVGLGAGWTAGVRLAPAASATDPSGTVSQPSSSGQDNASTPSHPVGTCLTGTTSISGQTTAGKVSYNEPHSWEVYQVGILAESTSGSSDNDLAANPSVQTTCIAQATQQYGAADPSTSVLGPGEADWNTGKRGFSCIASGKDGQRTSSYAGQESPASGRQRAARAGVVTARDGTGRTRTSASPGTPGSRRIPPLRGRRRRR